MNDLNNLYTEIEISKGNIIICMIDTPFLRDNIIEKLNKKFKLKKIQVENGQDIITILKKEKNKSPQINYDVILWILPEEVNTDILNALNIFRELFYDIDAPSLIFCNRNYLTTFIRQTPDFWRYRGNYYEFESDEKFQTFLKDTLFEPPFSYQNKDELLRKKRITEHILYETENDNEKETLFEELAFVYWMLGEINKTLRYFKKALDINRKMDNNIKEAHQLGNIGLVYRDKGEMNKALKYFREALEINRKKGQRKEEATQLGNIGLVYRDKGEMNKALKYFREALEINRKKGQRKEEAHQLGNIGLVYRDKGEMNKALKYFRKALKIERDIKYKRGEATQLGNIGSIYRKKRKLDEALNYYYQALKIERDIKYKRGEAHQLGNIGLVYRDKGEMNKALKFFREALEVHRAMGYKQGEAQQLTNMGITKYLMGKREDSLKYLNNALHTFKNIGTKDQVLTVKNYIREKIPDKTKKYKAKSSK